MSGGGRVDSRDRLAGFGSGGHCPACGYPVSADGRACGSCGFTGEMCLAMFEGGLPPMMPVLDAASLWSVEEVRMIEGAAAGLMSRFPQFRWNVCTLALPEGTDLSLFGFWMMNVSPLSVGETEEERRWSVLLLLDVESESVTAVPGYSAEVWFEEDDLRVALEAMRKEWRKGRSAKAVVGFLKASGRILESVWVKGKGRMSGRRRRR